uniref:RING-type E3 ubiquitin transferase n=1 Tax=Wollemia nobilis TaxID=56998 RepID=A0A0C9QX85_9CONI
MYPGNRPNLMTASNMQGSTNSANGTSHRSDGFYMQGRMVPGGFSSIERMSTEAAVGNVHPHPSLHIGSESEYIPYSGNRVSGLVENNYFMDGGRRTCKRKILEGTSGLPSYDDTQPSFGQEGGGSSRFTVPARHGMGSVPSFSTLGLAPGSVQRREEPAMTIPGLIPEDYRTNAVTGPTEAPRSVRGRFTPSYHEEQNLSHLRSSGNQVWHVQPRNTPAEQPNFDCAVTNTNALLRDQCHFPASSVFQRRNLIRDERTENMPPVSSHFSFLGGGRERPPLHAETSSSSVITGFPNQGWPMSGADGRISDNDLSSRNLMNRNSIGVLYTDPVLSSRAIGPWYPPQNPHMQDARAISGVAQGPVSSSRSGQSNHFNRSAGAISFTPPMENVANHVTGLRGPNSLRSSSWMEHRDDRNVRPLMRRMLDISLERLQSLQNEDDRHGIISEDVLLFDQSALYSAIDLHDRHRDMRLDVDNMTYEELLALEEQIGNVSTGLTEESISKCLKIKAYSSSTEASMEDETSQKCSICQEEFEESEQLGTLQCGHDHHPECIRKWLLQKNECPICKSSALKT